MLTVSQVSKAHGGRVLFEDVGLQVNAGDRIGLIGANGAGKTTLFSLILGECSPDTGGISFRRGVTCGFLPQESAPAGTETVLELAMGVSDEMRAVQEALRRHPDEHSHERHEAIAKFVDLDGYALEAAAKRILSGLAFREADFHRAARTLSGGWIMRAHLARLLVQQPDLLMLDEPTNHLDLETLGWFQNHLRSYPGAILTISHDREFLNLICREIVEISRRRLHRYVGNYDAFLAQKAAREEQYLAAYRNQQREIAHLEEFVNRFRAKASKASQAQERIKRLEKMERLEAPEAPEATVKFRFPQPPRSGQRVMRLQGVRQAYGDHVVYDGLDLELERGQRTVLVGPNGAGKSTLLKILGGLVPLAAGERSPGHNVSIGYFAQQRAEALDARRTVLAEALVGVSGVGEEAARGVLGAFLFRGDDVFKPVGVLSGGEKSRLALVKLLLNPPNLLLIDEPTTHLDLASIDALIAALKEFEGTIVFVSHDVHFIRAVAGTVIHIQGGCLTPYAGDYQYYLDKSRAGSERGALVASLQPDVDRAQPASGESASARPAAGMREIRAQRRAAAEERQAAARHRREQARRLAEAEAEILELEKRQRALTEQLEDPALYADPAKALEVNRELSGVAEALERSNELWTTLAAECAASGADA